MAIVRLFFKFKIRKNVFRDKRPDFMPEGYSGPPEIPVRVSQAGYITATE
jgi:hypothetical protein